MKCRYFRPSTICGRLIELPFGAINKYDVFYAWGAFFLRLKLKKIESLENKYRDYVELDVRVCYGLKNGINIVPADYAAKVMYQVCFQNAHGESFHLANNQETPHDYHLSYMLDAIKIKGIRRVDEAPKNMNSLERFYYKTVGNVFTPYMIAAPILFNVDNITDVLKNAGLSCPPIDEKNFPVLIDYAKKYDFGLDRGSSV